MKKSLPILILTLLAAFTASGQSEIHYTYDDAGNRISRSNVPVSNIFERGAIEMSQADANEWTTVSLDNTYENPVVIMGPISYDGGNPSTLRVKSVTSTSFQFQVDEWDYLDGSHTSEIIGYMVVESGLHTFGDLMWQAGVIESVDDNFQTVDFPREFDGTPVVLTQVSTYFEGEPTAVVTRTRNVNSHSFTVRVQEEEANDDHHAGEKVGYLAIEQGNTQVDGYPLETGTTGYSVDENWETLHFDHSFSSAVFLADIQTVNGGDPVGLRYRDLVSSFVEIFCEEEASADSETGHVNENVGYLVIENSGGIEQMSISEPIKITESTQDTTKESQTKEPNVEKSIDVYPNPTTGAVKVELSGYNDLTKASIRVLSISGSLIKQVKHPLSSHKLDLSTQPAGTYIIRVIIGEDMQEWKIIKN